MIALTGANGYVGRALAAELAGRGLATRGLVRSPAPGANQARFELDQPIADGALSGVETLIHAAHDFRPAREPDLRRVNLDGSRRLLEAAQRAGVRRIVFVSSLAAFDGAASVYGRLKRDLERDVQAIGGVSVRPGTVYGGAGGGLFAGLERVARVAPVLPDFGPRARIRLVHVDDLKRVVARLIELPAGATPPILPVAHPDEFTLREILVTLPRGAGKPARFVPAPAGLALAGLRALEAAGLTPPFRSDSLIGLLHGNPAPGLAPEVLGIRLRRFGAPGA